MTAICYIALGSNLGNREDNLHQALAAIAELPGTQVERVSPFILTTPVGGPAGQEDYCNAAARLTTELSPEELLKALAGVEQKLGRFRTGEIRHGPRLIDLDILFYNDLILEKPELTIPHPRLHERLFVLRPMAEIAPNLIHPRMGKSIMELLRACPMGSCP